MTVVMTEEMSLDNSVEKSEKKNDQDYVDGMSRKFINLLKFINAKNGVVS